MPLYEFEGKSPKIGKDCFIHPEAVLIGDVVIEDGCYVGAGAVLRADFGTITVKKGSNIQDNCVIHVKPYINGILGERSHIGHSAVLHSPNLGYHVTVGIGAIILDDCEIGDECLIGAGALVTSGSKIPPRSLVLGAPAKVIRELSEEQIKITNAGTDFYQELTRRSIAGLKRI